MKKTHAMKLLESGSKDNWPLMERILHFPPLINCKEHFCILSAAPPSILDGGMKKVAPFKWQKEQSPIFAPAKIRSPCKSLQTVAQTGAAVSIRCGGQLSPDCRPSLERSLTLPNVEHICTIFANCKDIKFFQMQTLA